MLGILLDRSCFDYYLIIVGDLDNFSKITQLDIKSLNRKISNKNKLIGRVSSNPYNLHQLLYSVNLVRIFRFGMLLEIEYVHRDRMLKIVHQHDILFY